MPVTVIFSKTTFRAAQSAAARRLRRHVAVLGGDLRAHLFERLQMQIHRARADGAAPGERDARVSRAADQRSQRQNRGAHRAHQFVRRLGV